MIFVTVGTHNQGFERLIKKMDEIAGKIDEEIVMQVGYTDYEPENAEWFEFCEYEELLSFIKRSDVIICHGGAGTLLDSLKFNKKIVVVPRLEKFDEVYDDHELELAGSLRIQNRIFIALNVEDLEKVIKEEKFSFDISKNNQKLVNFLKNYLTGD
jgi:UDP-N-acetylglucosamine transferase subunit ALG13